MSAALYAFRTLQKPTTARCFVLLLLLARAASAQEAAAPAALTEEIVVARALARAPLADAIAGEVAIEEGRGLVARAAPNPDVSYLREQTLGALGSSEDSLSVAQVLDLGNRRGLHGRAGAARARAASREGEAARLAVAAEARMRFYEVLLRQERTVALESWAARIEDALAIVARREQRGDAATYDRRRLERERAVAAGRLEVERAALDRSRARLHALVGTGVAAPSAQVTGKLLPDDAPGELVALRAASDARPELIALAHRIEAASLDGAAAARWWVPTLRLEGGWKGVDLGSQGRADGFLLGASLSIPLWDRSSGLARMAEGEARAARGRRALLRSEIEGEIGGALAEALHLRDAARKLREQTAAASGDLVRIASAGYAGGELGLLELLDAYRGAAEDSLTALDMEHAARRARLELDRLTGAALR